VCEGTVAWRCGPDGDLVDPTNCGDSGLVCAPEIGCASCIPGATSCSDGIGTYCSSDGMSEESFECDPMQGLDCQPDGCKGACTPQKLGRRHIGCDFWPTVTANSVWGTWFPFGVLVVNTADQDATIIVTRNEENVGQRSLPPGNADVIELPWIPSLKGPDADDEGQVTPPEVSVLSRSDEGGGAYRLRSDQPVVVTQLNTVRSQDENAVSKGCPPDTNHDTCLSYSNDGSLLLPAHALGLDYVLMGWQAWAMDNGIGMGDFVSMTALEDGTTLVVTPRAPTLAFEGDEPLTVDEPAEFTLDRGDVLQLFTDGVAAGAQWAGSEVSANHPLQVLTGAPCVNVPEGIPTCDHVEETNLPRSMLGKRYLVTAPKDPGGRQRHLVRIHGIENETLVEFDPPTAHKPVTLNAGEVVQLEFPTSTESEIQHFLVSSNHFFGVTQYMVGNQAEPNGPNGPGLEYGDPSQTFVVPTSRYLARYDFALAPGFEHHQVDVIASTGAQVLIDGEAMPSSAFQAIGASGLSVARVEDLSVLAHHELESDKPIGVQIRGYGRFTSYMTPGGVDLRPASQ